MISLGTIAKDLGISKGAVSQILSGKARQARISEELEARVKRYSEAMNYKPNIHARRLNSRLVGNVGVLIGHCTGINDENPFSDCVTAKIVGGISVAADKAKYRFSMQLCRPDSDDGKIFNWFRDKEIDGLLYYGFNLPEHWIRVFKEESRLVVGIGIAPVPGIGSVNTDNWKLSNSQCRHLLERGRRRFLYFGGKEQSNVATERFKGFKAALDDAGVLFRDADFIRADFNEDTARSRMLEKLSTGEFPDAVVCANDYMSIGVMMALEERGIKMPEQVAITGADNIPLAAHMAPSLTTFDNQPSKQGELAFSLLMEMLNGKPARDITLEGIPAIRAST